MSIGNILFYAGIALLTTVVYLVRKRFNYFKDAGIAYEEPSLLLGNMTGLQKTRGFSDIWFDYYYKFKGTGPFAGFFLFQRPAAFILDIELIKNILIKDFSKFTDRGFFHNPKDDPLSGQLFLIDGQKWRNMRNKLSPTFTSGKMKFMFPIVVDVSKNFGKVFANMVSKSAVVEVKEILARFTTDVIGTCAFGIECNSLNDPDAQFRIMGRKALVDQRHNNLGSAFINSFPTLARLLRMKLTPDHIEEFFMRVVKENVDYRERNNVRRNDFMDMLIDLKNNKLIATEKGMDLTNLTIGEVAAQAFVFFSAGFETSSTTMGYALYELAQHTDIQQKARDEVQSVLAKYDQKLSYECVNEMQYLDQIIAETLRLHTIVPVLNRQAIVDYVVPGNPRYKISKGMPVLIPAEAIHLDPEFYPNPNVFDPDRFAPEMIKERDSVLSLSFGEGPRNCIGMRFGKLQTRIGLAVLLNSFKFTTCKETQIPLQYDVKSFLKTTKDGIYLRAEKV